MRNGKSSWASFGQRLTERLEAISSSFEELLDASTIEYVNPNSPYSSVLFIGAADWGWGAADDLQSRLRLVLLKEYDEWFSLFRMLFPQPTPDIAASIQHTDEFVRQWINRDQGSYDHAIPRTTTEAKDVLKGKLATFFDLLRMLAPSAGSTTPVLGVPDTNALITSPVSAITELRER